MLFLIVKIMELVTDKACAATLMLSASNFVCCSILPFKFAIVSSGSSASSGFFLLFFFEFEFPVDVDDDDEDEDEDELSSRFFVRLKSVAEGCSFPVSIWANCSTPLRFNTLMSDTNHMAPSRSVERVTMVLVSSRFKGFLGSLAGSIFLRSYPQDKLPSFGSGVA